MRLSIRTKFLLLITVLLLAIFGLITLYQISNSTNRLRADLYEQSRAFASLATQPIGNVFAIYKDSGTSKIDQEISTFSKLNTNVTDIAIVDVLGSIVYSEHDMVNLNVSKDEASTFEPIYRNNSDGTLELIIFPYFEASGAHRFSMVYSVSDDEISSALRREAQSLFYFGLVSLLMTMALVYVLINRLIIQPVRQVSEQAGFISAGNLEQQILVRGHDEISSLGQSVNKMAESLKANIAELKEVDKVKSEFMMITSHNLRTPLTIISGYLDNMDMVIKDTDKLMTALTRIGASVKRLEVFAEDVLTISRLELGHENQRSQITNIGEFFGQVCEEFLSVAEQKELKFSADIQNPDDDISISVPYVRSAVWNILDNAVKFTKPNGTIKLQTMRENNNLEIVITDTGTGISNEEIPKLFTKFHRGTSTLVYDFDGTGIGLYASKMMIEKQGGTISVKSEIGKGSEFTISLPFNNPTSSNPIN